jgi:hypothetical protein
MKGRFRTLHAKKAAWIAVIAAVFFIPVIAAAQAGQPSAKSRNQTWTKKTPDGQPDIQGFWSSSTNVPLERPANCGTKEFWTDEEMAKGIRTCDGPATGQRRGAPAQAGGQRGGQRGNADPNPHYDLAQFGLNLRTQAVNNRTSLIIGPEGRIPPLSEFGKQRQAELAERRTNFDSAENRPLTERCIIWTAQGPPLMSPGYNSNLQIVQSEGHVMILPEMMQDARIIPLKPRGALPENIRLWAGDSQGRWEGDTLVIETTNFNGRNPFQRVGSEKLRLTERLTRLDENTLRYEFTINDPVWIRPWTVEVLWSKSEGPIFEYACHEGNYAMTGGLAGARTQEKAAGK